MKYFFITLGVLLVLISCNTTVKLAHPNLHADGFYRTYKKGSEQTELLRFFKEKLIIVDFLEKKDDNGKYDAAIMCNLDTTKKLTDYITCNYKIKGDSIFFTKVNLGMPFNLGYKGKIFKDSLQLLVFITDYDKEVINPSVLSVPATYKFQKAKCDEKVDIPIRDFEGWNK